MSTSLALTCLLMGLAGGPHCTAMCGVACAGLGRAAGARHGAALWGFQAGRLAGYAALGALAAASMQGIGWLGAHVAALRPFWTLLHVAALALGCLLLAGARQPVWMDRQARALWQRLRQLGGARGGPVLLGALWALLPCGLLYSALVVAALAGGALAGAGSMALFAVGSGAWLLAGPWLLLRLGRAGGGPAAIGAWRGDWGVRLAGLALAASAGWALLHGTPSGQALLDWCASAAAGGGPLSNQ